MTRRLAVAAYFAAILLLTATGASADQLDDVGFSIVDARLLLAFGFGFVHSFGFANALRELELPREALVAALFPFNLGVECGQACIVLAVAPLLAMLHRTNDRLARYVAIGVSLAVVAAGAFWFVPRVCTR